MDRNIKTKFYTTMQNNSGGYFIVNDDVAQYVIVEARSFSEARRLLEDITEDYSKYCPCCGERWSSWFHDNDGTEKPTIYGVPLDEVRKEIFRENAIVYYYDGTKKFIEFE